MDRSTRQKRAIESVLRNHHNPLTPPEIHALALKRVPAIGLATVYRSLRALMNEGRVVSVEIPGQPPRYERADKGHHHHFLCRVCGEVFELEKCPDGYQENGTACFCVENHEIILYGSCEQCAPKRKPTKRRALAHS